MKARKLTLLAAILSAFALTACDKAEDTTAPTEPINPPVTESTPGTTTEPEVAPADEAYTLPEPADESEFSESVDNTIESAKKTTEDLVERAKESAAEASDKVKELTDNAIETTKEVTAKAKTKAEEAVENVRQSFSSETGVTDATVDPTAPIEPEVTPLTAGSVTTGTAGDSDATGTVAGDASASATATDEKPDLVGEIIEQNEGASAVEQSPAEQALEEVQEAGVEVREAVETDLEDGARTTTPSSETTTDSAPETESQSGTTTPQ
ncbi:Uncharacterised protein [Oligella ureolytica]|uniref:YtxH domain-containing protein n=1 Tax=Oligella ureolytica TaxID=90244 RepID=A0A378XAA2_9BURK|nr:YtxH domain-containing protein [Oligella ureolytica]QPT40249.1 YtxH domain-containing protein [Oligella ureolytica]SUA50514.1 Uncharacterised protein [Oligella ureolytica]